MALSKGPPNRNIRVRRRGPEAKRRNRQVVGLLLSVAAAAIATIASTRKIPDQTVAPASCATNGSNCQNPLEPLDEAYFREHPEEQSLPKGIDSCSALTLDEIFSDVECEYSAEDLDIVIPDSFEAEQ